MTYKDEDPDNDPMVKELRMNSDALGENGGNPFFDLVFPPFSVVVCLPYIVCCALEDGFCKTIISFLSTISFMTDVSRSSFSQRVASMQLFYCDQCRRWREAFYSIVFIRFVCILTNSALEFRV